MGDKSRRTQFAILNVSFEHPVGFKYGNVRDHIAPRYLTEYGASQLTGSISSNLLTVGKRQTAIG
jgi:hypothetical protein